MNGRDADGEAIIEYKPDFNDDDKLKLMLGHSCDEWIIGDLEEAKHFYAQLGAAIDRVENSPEQEFNIYD